MVAPIYKINQISLSDDNKEIPPLESDLSEIYPAIKDLKTHLENEEWKEASEIYKTLPWDLKQNIQEWILTKDSEQRFQVPITSKNIHTVISICFTAKQTLHFDFLNHYLYPAIQHIYNRVENQEKIEDVFNYIRQAFPISPNYPTRNSRIKDALEYNIKPNVDFDDLFRSIVYQLGDKLNEFREKRSSYLMLPTIQSSTFIKRIYSIQMARDIRIGNCAEMASAGFYYSILHKTMKRQEIFIIDNGDHLFIVYDRPLDSDQTDHTTWHGALVSDGWKKGRKDDSPEPNIFPASEMPKYLYNFEGNVGIETRLRKFDPSFHKLKLVESDVYSVRDFHDALDIKEDVSEKDRSALLKLESQLKEFHSADPEGKIDIAKEIIAEHPKKISQTQNRGIVKNLVAQMRCFVDPHYVDVFNIGPKIQRSAFAKINFNQFFEGYISAITISHLVRISDLIKNANESTDNVYKVVKRFNNLPSKLKEQILALYLGETKEGEDFIPDFDLLAAAIDSWIISKYDIAKTNERTEEMEKIYNLLPNDLQLRMRS